MCKALDLKFLTAAMVWEFSVVKSIKFCYYLLNYTTKAIRLYVKKPQ